MFDFVTVLGSITDILVTEINVSKNTASKQHSGQVNELGQGQHV